MSGRRTAGLGVIASALIAFPVIDAAANPRFPIQRMEAYSATFVTADLNGDHHQDLVLYPGPSVFLGNGSGDFTRLPDASIGYRSSIALGDFDEDGKLDIFTVDTRGGQLLQGNGDGTFSPGPGDYSYSLSGPVVAADVNGDGHLDVIGAANGVGILLGRGDGTFEERYDFLWNTPTRIAVADLNGDGKLDIIVGTYGTVVCMFGNGDGTFEYDEWRYPIGVYDMVVGDRDGDGIVDVTVVSLDFNTAEYTLNVMRNDGTGALEQILIADVAVPRLLDVDIDGDGAREIVFFTDGWGTVSVLEWDAGAGFTTRSTGQRVPTDAVAGADFNEDGRTDLVVPAPYSPSTEVVLSKAPEGWFVPYQIAPVANRARALLGDFDNDRVQDVLSFGYGPYDDAVFLHSAGDGTFVEGGTTQFEGWASYPLAGDINEDGRLDVVIADRTNNGPTAYLGNGDGTFRLGWSLWWVPPGTIGAALRDFNGDGHLDLVRLMDNGVGGRIEFFAGVGDGTFANPVSTPISVQLGRPLAADINGDGNVDLVAIDGASRSVEVLLGTGQGTFTPQPPIPVNELIHGIELADFNLDGRLDLVVATEQGSSLEFGRLFQFFGRGDGTFQLKQTLQVRGQPLKLAAGDFDADGRPDLAVAAYGITLFRSQPDGTFGTPELFGGLYIDSDQWKEGFVAADLNGDGLSDILGNGITVALNDGALPNGPPVAVAGSDQTVECTGDLSAIVQLDGSASFDPDAPTSPGGRIASYLWSEAGATLASTASPRLPFHLGSHEVTLTVTDSAGATGVDDAVFTVQDTLPPTGKISFPPAHACFGPSALPVTLSDNFSDVCDPTISRRYEPAPGPSYSTHGDHHVLLTAGDEAGNSTDATVDFTIDTVPPTVAILEPAAGQRLVPASLPLSIVFLDADDDGAAGGVIHETISLQGCLVYDGATYGNRDGLLRDESIALTEAELCRIAAQCGFASLDQPELLVEATDCGGNVGVDSHRLAGSIQLQSGLCGPAQKKTLVRPGAKRFHAGR